MEQILVGHFLHAACGVTWCQAYKDEIVSCPPGTHCGGEDIAYCPLGSQSQSYWIWTIAVIPKFFGTRDRFHGRTFFRGPEVEVGNGFRMIQVLCAGQEAIVRTGHGTTDWFQIRKGVH